MDAHGIIEFNSIIRLRCCLGNLEVWRIMSWFTNAILTLYRTTDDATDDESTFNDYDKLERGRQIFVRAIVLTVDRQLYRAMQELDAAAAAADAFVTDVRLANSGRTSWDTVCVLTQQSSARTLATFSRRTVGADRATKKVAALPDWWKEKYSRFSSKDQSLDLPVLRLPSDPHVPVHRHTVYVKWAETDFVQHVNYRYYVVYCFEAAMTAIKTNFYIGFYGDILNYSVRRLRALYVAEAMAGDALNVVTWQNLQNPNLLHFVIAKEGSGKNIFQCSAEFFTKSNL